MLKINKPSTKATCIEDLSHLEGKISSDIYEEKFPIIGKTYKIDSAYLMNEKRDAAGRCVPKRGLDAWEDIIKIHLFGWKTPEDMFEEEEGFDNASFIYQDDPDKIYRYLKERCNINIRLPSYKEKLAEVYKSGRLKRGYWFISMPEDRQKSYLAAQNAIAKHGRSEEGMKAKKVYEKHILSPECKPGGQYYNKPYHGLKVVGERVVELGRNESFVID